VNWKFFVVERLHDAYGLVNRLGVLDNPVMSDLFVRTYFAYKRLGDPFATLTRRRPDLFRGGHILDVGANIGYTAAVFARAVSPGFKVFAFEPDRRNYERLARTLRRLGYADRSEAVHAAVGAADGTIGIWQNYRHHAGHRVSTDVFRAERGVSTTDQVPLLSLDRFVRDRGLAATVRFIKVDVEGYESAVCEGMKETLRANPDVCVAMEYAPVQIRELGLEPAALLDFFPAQGFVIHALGEHATIEPFDAKHPERHLGVRGYVDLVCARRRLAS
jgi:FkbM family methyltransferase